MLRLLSGWTILPLFAVCWWSGLAESTGDTSCLSSELDWYTDVVGETPCETYQRLRQICNGDYTVPKFNPSSPGDICDDQISDCCCNSIAWGLSMLCQNCQYDAKGDSTGIDAGVGSYQQYVHYDHCTHPTNKTLPADVQAAVCNKAIKIDRNLYSQFWSTGDCVHVKEVMTEDFAATNNNTFTHCNSTLHNTTTSTSALLSVSTVTSSSALPPVVSSSALPPNVPQETSGANVGSSTHLAQILGGAIVGIVVVLVVVFGGLYIVRRQGRRRGPRPLDLTKKYRQRVSSGSQFEPMAAVTPFTLTRHNDSRPREPASLPFSLQIPASKYMHRTSPPQQHAAAAQGAERDEDAGPLAVTQRFASEKLPPLYRRSWDDASDPSEPGVSTGLPDDVGVEWRGQWPGRETKVRGPS
ncbi:hypothetical protein FKP32DRAFT_122803 [Trametes sanguinea]|nr:hypothetical protein FKP32DRAFT_122803 [Trametes sanguinea]